MGEQAGLRGVIRLLTTSTPALAIAVGAQAAAPPWEPDLRIAVQPDHYVLNGRVIDDLDALERAVEALRPRMLQLDACGGGTARAQRAAVHRFRALYLELRVSETDAPGCQATAAAQLTPVVQRPGRRPTGIDDEAVDRWWQQLMP